MTKRMCSSMEHVQLHLGVYGVRVSYKEKQYTGVMNVGVRPTIKQGKEIVHYEVHIFNFNEMIYNETLQIDICFFVREEISFSSMDELIKQIKKDAEVVKSRLGQKEESASNSSSSVGEAI